MWVIVGLTDEDNEHLIAGFDSIEEARTNLQILNTNMYYSVDIVEFEIYIESRRKIKDNR